MQMYRYKECTIFLSLIGYQIYCKFLVSVVVYILCTCSAVGFHSESCSVGSIAGLNMTSLWLQYRLATSPAFFLHMQHNGWSCEKYKPGIYCRGSSRGVRRRLKVGEGEVVHIKHVLGIQFMIISVRIQTSTCSSRNKWAFSTDSGII